MPDNKNSNKNNGGSLNESVGANERKDYSIRSLQTDNDKFVPPPVSKLNGNGSDNDNNNNNNDK